MSIETKRGHVVDHREAFDYGWGKQVGEDALPPLDTLPASLLPPAPQFPSKPPTSDRVLMRYGLALLAVLLVVLFWVMSEAV